MAETFHLSLLTPERSFFERDVVSIVAPGAEGYLGLLAHHAPLITALQSGTLEIVGADGSESLYAISGGFLEVSSNRATILADSVELPADIDLSRAERARDRARDRLRGKSGAIDVPRAEGALRRALNRIRIAGLS